jgi:5-methylcytosine-specific restriction protein A
MPTAALKPCLQPGCPALVAFGRCDRHKQTQQRQQDERRGSSNERGYGSAWQKARAAFLRKHPLCECEDCQAGVLRTLAARVVDHKVPHRGDRALFWDSSNWQAMAIECHNRKTVREDGGFGNPRREARGG